MAAVTVGTSAVQISAAFSRPVIQNLGPGLVYIDTESNVTTSSGMQVPVGAAYEWPVAPVRTSAQIWAIADTAGTNVRVIDAE